MLFKMPGVTKKLTSLWVTGRDKILDGNDQNAVSMKIQMLYASIPKDFARKPRPLSEMAQWKATEWRCWLLYIGPVVLFNILPEDHYRLFATLSFSIRLLTQNIDIHKDTIDYAETLLKNFVQQCEVVIGAWFISQNVHNLIHLANDVRRFGSLENFSAFPFENFLKQLKRQVKSGNKPLQQVRNRYHELLMLSNTSSRDVGEKINFIEVGKLCRVGTVDFDIPSTTTFFKAIRSGQIRLKTGFGGNNFCLVHEDFIKIFYIFRDESTKEIFLAGKKFETVENLYEEPAPSSIAGVYVLKTLLPDFKVYNSSDLKCKLFVMQDYNDVNKFFAVQLLH